MLALLFEAPASSTTAVAFNPFGAFAVIGVTVWFLPAVIRLLLPPALAPERAPVRWNSGHVALVVLAIVAARLIAGFVHPSVETDLAGILVESTAVFGVGVVVAVAIADRLGSGDLRPLGIRSGSTGSAPARALFVYALALPGILGIGVVWAWILGHFGATDLEQPLVAEFAKLAPSERLLPVLIGVLVLPLCEEILFRGFLQSLVVQRLGVVAGILSTSFFFALLHGPQVFPPIFALSCLLGLVMVRTQRLHASWIVHALHNGLQFTLLYMLPDEFKHNAVPGSIAGWIGVHP